jgi:hypothetical protein
MSLTNSGTRAGTSVEVAPPPPCNYTALVSHLYRGSNTSSQAVERGLGDERRVDIEPF